MHQTSDLTELQQLHAGDEEDEEDAAACHQASEALVLRRAHTQAEASLKR